MTIFTSVAKILVKKKNKYMKSLKAADCKACCVDIEVHVKPVKLSSHSVNDESSFIASKSFSTVEKSSAFIPNTPIMDSIVIAEHEGDAAYEDGAENDEILTMERCYSDFDLQTEGEIISCVSSMKLKDYISEDMTKTNEGITFNAMVTDGYASDPGIAQTVFSKSSLLDMSKSSAKRSSSHSDLTILWGNDMGKFLYDDHLIPLSFKTPYSADHLILQRHPSCQPHPLRSGNILWNLCLWSDGNLGKPCAPQSLALVRNTAYEKVGYSSDIHECAEELDEKKSIEIDNQWIAFSLQSSSHDRVYTWINSLEEGSFYFGDNNKTYDGREDDGIACTYHMDAGVSSWKNHSHNAQRETEEMIHTNNIIRSLNSFSSAVRFSGLGLKVIPFISAFGSLKSISLSRNFIAHINPGCLPKNIHTLDLSRNKLSAIEGLRDLTRLRVLNLSHNRISRIGHGLSSCIFIKELYLSGNRISDVEGLHRLLKLTVLDLSFNKITTAKAFCQLVANYNSLFSLNLLGNPIQSNAGDDHIRKAVVSFLPHIRYLNKQPIKQHRAREVAANCVASAVAGDGRWNSRRRPVRWSAQGTGVSAKSKNGNQLKRKHQHSSSVRK